MHDFRDNIVEKRVINDYQAMFGQFGVKPEEMYCVKGSEAGC